MSPSPEDQWRPPEPPGRPNRPNAPRPTTPRSRWLPWVVIGVVVIAVLVWRTAPTGSPDRAQLDYGEFLTLVDKGAVESIKYDQSNGKIVGEFKPGHDQGGKSAFQTQGPLDQLPEPDVRRLDAAGVRRDYKPPSSDWFTGLLYFLLPIGLLIL